MKNRLAKLLVEQTLQFTLRPKLKDRIDVIQLVLVFVINNYRQPQDDLDYGPAVVEVGDLENLIEELEDLKSAS